jgi:type II secretory pathway pseudopilin PulG
MTVRRGSLGYTLAELLAVVALLALLATLAVGVFTALPARYAHEQAAGTVRTLLRRARAAAIESRAGARVVFDGRRMAAEAWKPLGLWRFEDELAPGGAGPVRAAGARGMDALVSGASQEEGALGKALFFTDPGGFADCGNAPVFSPTAGVRVVAMVYPADFARLREDPATSSRPAPPAAPGRRAGPDAPWVFQVAGKGEEYSLALREDYAVLARVKGERGLYLARETRPGAVTPGRWTEVAMDFADGALEILVDGVRRDLDPATDDPAPRRLIPTEAPLTISSPDRALCFVGGIDEVALYGMVAEEETSLPEDVAVDAPPAVRFDAQGELDPLYHEGPVAVSLRLTGSAPPGAPPLARVLVERSGALR